MGRISSFMLWVLLGVAVALVPLACSSSSSTGDGSTPTDTAHNPDSMTQT
jgi:hypothetical protein